MLKGFKALLLELRKQVKKIILVIKMISFTCFLNTSVDPSSRRKNTVLVIPTVKKQRFAKKRVQSSNRLGCQGHT